MLKVQGVDYFGKIIEEKTIVVTLDKDASPLVDISSKGVAWKVPIAQSIELDASDTTDPELGRIDFSWEYPDKDLEILDGGQGQALRAQFHKPGVYPFTLKATRMFLEMKSPLFVKFLPMVKTGSPASVVMFSKATGPLRIRC